MTDREKIIKEWEAVLSRDPLDAPWDLIDDTLTLLKDQETVFEADGDGYADGELVFDEWYCHACGYHFPDDDMPRAKYCPECGRKFRGNEFKASNSY